MKKLRWRNISNCLSSCSWEEVGSGCWLWRPWCFGEFLFVHHLELEVFLESRDAPCLALSNSVLLGHIIWLLLHHQADLYEWLLLGQGFSITVLVTFEVTEFLAMGGWPTHYRTFSNIPGFCSLETNSILAPSCDNQKCLETLPNVAWQGGAKLPLVENH